MNAKPVDLFIAGAQKAGTTSLFEYIKQHPEILGHQQREMTYFFNDHEIERGYEEAFGRYFSNAGRGHRTVVAKHVMAMYSREALERLRQHNPQTRLVVLLRNPISRAYSAYWYARRNGWEILDSFAAALEAETARIGRDGWRHWRDCAYVYNGRYDIHLRRIYEIFDPARVKVYTIEDLKKDASGVVQDIYRWIGVDDTFSPEVAKAHNASAMARSEWLARLFASVLRSRNPLKLAIRSMMPNKLSYTLRHAMLRANEKSFHPPPMDDCTLNALIERFIPHNAKLAGLLRRDLTDWNGR